MGKNLPTLISSHNFGVADEASSHEPLSPLTPIRAKRVIYVKSLTRIKLTDLTS